MTYPTTPTEHSRTVLFLGDWTKTKSSTNIRNIDDNFSTSACLFANFLKFLARFEPRLLSADHRQKLKNVSVLTLCQSNRYNILLRRFKWNNQRAIEISETLRERKRERVCVCKKKWKIRIRKGRGY